MSQPRWRDTGDRDTEARLTNRDADPRDGEARGGYRDAEDRFGIRSAATRQSHAAGQHTTYRQDDTAGQNTASRGDETPPWDDMTRRIERGRPSEASRGQVEAPRGQVEDPRGQAEAPRGQVPDRTHLVVRWGRLPGRFGVFVVIGSAALGALLTTLTGSSPGIVLGVFLVAGTVAATLAVRPRTGYLIVPVPAIAYLLAALIAGLVYARSGDGSRTMLAVNGTQWIASGFIAMTAATALAILITAIRWWRSSPASARPGTKGRPPGGRDPSAPRRRGS